MFMFTFYDAPTPPPGLFDEFLEIPAIVNTVSTTTFADFFLSLDPLAGAQRLVVSPCVVQEVTELTESSSAPSTAGYLSASTRRLSLTLS